MHCSSLVLIAFICAASCDQLLDEGSYMARDSAWKLYLRGIGAFTESVDNSLHELVKSYNVFPNAASARKLAWIYDMLGDQSSSLHWQRCVAQLDNATLTAWMHDGIRKHYAGEYHAALLHYDNILIIDPQHTDAMYHKGIAYQYLGDVQQAAEYYYQTIQLDNFHTKAILNLAALHQKYGSYADAVTYYLKGVAVFATLRQREAELAPSGTPYLHPHETMVQYNMGLAYMQLNQLDKVGLLCVITIVSRFFAS